MSIRVLHVSSDTGLFGGKDRVLLWLLVSLKRNNLADPIFVCFREGLVAQKYREAGLSVTVLPMSGPFDIRAVPRLARLVKEQRVGIIHTHDHKSHVLGRLSKLFCDVRVISTLHGLISDAKEIPQPRRFIYGALVSLTHPLTDHWIAVSRPLFERFRGRTQNVSLIQNSVDRSMVESDARDVDVKHEDGRVILSLGRLSREKGQDILMDAFSTVAGNVPDAVLWIAGEGPEEPNLRRQAVDLGIADRVRFLGFRESVSPLLRESYMLVLPSRGEGMPISVLEAMSLGVPVIASAVGGVPDLIVSHEVGVTVPPENPDALAGAMLDLLRSVVDARKMGEAGRVHVESLFSLERMATETADVYRRFT